MDGFLTVCYNYHNLLQVDPTGTARLAESYILRSIHAE